MLPGDCASCDFPGINLANLPAWEVLAITGAALFDGMGGVNLSNARLVCETLGHEWDRAMVTRICRGAEAFLSKDDTVTDDDGD